MDIGKWKLQKEDQDKIAFTSHNGLYRFVRIWFGSENAPGLFESTMEAILTSVKWQFALVHFNDIVIFSKTPGKHIDHDKQEIALLERVEVTLELKKCFFFTDTIDILEHIIRPRRLELAAHNADVIRNIKETRNITDLRTTLGLHNIFRRFVSSFARIAAPLNRKLQKD